MGSPEDRCRLVLIVPQAEDAGLQAKALEDALRGGDVASVIIPQYALDDDSFQKRAEVLVPIVQAAGAAALVAGDSRVAGRVKADGQFAHLHCGQLFRLLWHVSSPRNVNSPP